MTSFRLFDADRGEAFILFFWGEGIYKIVKT
jgi:hypothetical protein